MYAEHHLDEPTPPPVKMADLPLDEREAYWYDHVYRPNAKQLTVRAVIMGMVLGAVMSVSNLYVGLKIGWGFGVTITAGILAFAIFKALERWLPGGHFTDLENNSMQSVASAAGAMSSAGLTSAIPALLLLNGTSLPPLWLGLWIGAISFLGVVVAIPLKRQMINIDQLPFPSGIAAAETIRGLHGEGTQAMKKAKALGLAALIAATWDWFKDGSKVLMTYGFDTLKHGLHSGNLVGVVHGWPTFGGMLHGARMLMLGAVAPLAAFAPTHWLLQQTERLMTWGLPDPLTIFPKTISGIDATDKLTLNADVSVMLYAAGAIMGMRSAVSILIGGILNWFFIAPWLIHHQITVYSMVKKPTPHFEWVAITGGFPQVAKWSTWPGTGMLTVSVLIGLAFQWKSLARAFGGILDLVRTKKEPVDARIAAIEVPNSWFASGLLLSGLACVILCWVMFHIHPLLGVLSIGLAIVLSMVATRVAGETDIAPLGAMGKMTQFAYAIVSPGNAVHNLMSANVTAGAAGHTSDLLTDLKSGYLLGANPRQQFLAQFFGVCAGTLACVPAYFLMVPADPDLLQKKFAAPAALVWEATAQTLSQGLATIPPTALKFAVFTLAFGAIVTVIEQMYPQSKKFLPSPTGVGLAFVLPFGNSLAMFVGAVIAWIITKWNKQVADDYIVTVSSGLIAGESLMAVAVMALLLLVGLT